MGEKVYGLLGRKLGHSWSAPIHAALGCADYRLIELEPEELEYGRLEAEYRGLLAEWKMSESYWTPESGIPDAVAAAKARCDEAFKRWHEQCMAWLGVYEEVHGETDFNV